VSKGPLYLAARYRSGLEQRVAKQLREEGVAVDFESHRVPYLVPQREAKYLPDFHHKPTGIILEAKGWFKTASERQKYIHVRNSNPGIDIRFVFQNARKPIYKGSKTTYAKWATDHDFKWSDKGLVPAAWVNEMKQAETKGK
jgi:hypothetical protein